MDAIEQEWNKVKNLKLYSHYGKSQKLYQRWRNRFIRRGFLQPKTKAPKSKAEILAKKRTYYAEWRKKNRHKIEQYNLKHWSKKIHQQSVPAY